MDESGVLAVKEAGKSRDIDLLARIDIEDLKIVIRPCVPAWDEQDQIASVDDVYITYWFPGLNKVVVLLRGVGRTSRGLIQ